MVRNMFFRARAPIVFFSVLVLFQYTVVAFLADAVHLHSSSNATNKVVPEALVTSGKYHTCPSGAMWVKNKCRLVLPDETKSATQPAESRFAGDSTASVTDDSLRETPFTTNKLLKCPQGSIWLKGKCRLVVSGTGTTSTRGRDTEARSTTPSTSGSPQPGVTTTRTTTYMPGNATDELLVRSIFKLVDKSIVENDVSSAQVCPPGQRMVKKRCRPFITIEKK